MTRAELIRQWPTLDRTHPDISMIEDYVNWRKTPPFRVSGRSGWCTSPDGLRLEDGHLIRSYKIKGVGHNVVGEVRPPADIPYNREREHFGFTDSGEFITLKNKHVAPRGGMTFDKAESEFETSAQLVRKGCPSQVPLLLYKYTDLVLTLEGQKPKPLGVVVTGLLCEHHFRGGSVFDALVRDRSDLNDEMTELVDPWTRGLSANQNDVSTEEMLRTFTKLQGSTLRKFHEAGIFRFSAYPPNFGYDHHTNQIFLIDLDSSLPLHDCNAKTRPLQIMRDLVSALFHMSRLFIIQENIHAMPWQGGLAVSLLRSFLSGYFHEFNTIPIPFDDVVETGFKSWYAFAIDHHATSTPISAEQVDIADNWDNFKKVLALTSDGTPFEEVHKKVYARGWTWVEKIERGMYVTFMTIAWALYQRSKLVDLHPNVLNSSHLYEQIAAFNSPTSADELRRIYGDF